MSGPRSRRCPPCIRLPAGRSKVNEPRVIPLSPLAMSVIAALPAIGPFVFSSRGDKPFGNISHSKARSTT